MRQIVTIISHCGDCPHSSHSGAFTPGGAKGVCGNPEIVKLKGYPWINRVLPDTEEIPEWCPLTILDQPNMGVTES